MQVVRGTARIHGCSASIAYPQTTYPPTVNDGQLLAMVGKVAEELVGAENWQIAEGPSMAAEDFAWLASTPTCSPNLCDPISTQDRPPPK